MVAFLSDEWIEAMDLAASTATLGPIVEGVDLVVEQHVETPAGGVTYHVTFGDGRVSVRRGPAEHPTVRFSQDLSTAVDVALGATSAQRAFMTGRLRVGGDLSVLLAHGELLGALEDVFADVRAGTELPTTEDPA